MSIELAREKASEWALEILRANGWTGEAAHTRRLIIDVPHGRVPMIYVEQYADSATFEVRAVPLGAEVVKAEPEPEPYKPRPGDCGYESPA